MIHAIYLIAGDAALLFGAAWALATIGFVGVFLMGAVQWVYRRARG